MKYIAIIVSLFVATSLQGQAVGEIYVDNQGNIIQQNDSLSWGCSNDDFVKRTSEALMIPEIRVPAQLNTDKHEQRDLKTISLTLNLMGTKRTKAQIEDYEQYINEAFANYGRHKGGPFYSSHPARAIDSRIRFRITTTKEYNYSGPWTQTAVNNAKKNTGSDRTKNLNIWVFDKLLSDNGQPGLGGFAYLPGAHGMWLDGVVIRGDLLLHFAIVHEIGHSLGLYHTFNGGCNGQGDFIDDTPFDGRAGGENCGQPMNTCDNDSYTDNYENYMDYGQDRCKNNFTPGQSSVMYAVLTSIRASYLSNQPNPPTDDPDDDPDDPTEPTQPNVVFTGITAKDGKLTWTVKDEVKIFKYQVQRSDIKNVNWHTIHEVKNVGSDSYIVDIITESGYRVRAIQDGGKVLKYSPMVIYRPESEPDAPEEHFCKCETLLEIGVDGNRLYAIGHTTLDSIAASLGVSVRGSRLRKAKTIINYCKSINE